MKSNNKHEGQHNHHKSFESIIRQPIQRIFKKVLGNIASSPISVFRHARKAVDISATNPMLSSTIVSGVDPSIMRTVKQYPPIKSTRMYSMINDVILHDIQSHADLSISTASNKAVGSNTTTDMMSALDHKTLDIIGKHGDNPVTVVEYSRDATTQSTSQTDVVIYIHGGAFVMGSPLWLNYELFSAYLSRELNNQDGGGTTGALGGINDDGTLAIAPSPSSHYISTAEHPTATASQGHPPIKVASIDYSLAPEHPFPSALLDCLGVFYTISRDPTTRRIFLAGDSAGGNLALAVAIALTNMPEVKQPAGVVAFSPVTSISPLGFSLSQLGSLDAYLPADAFGVAMQAYFGLANVSPLLNMKSIRDNWERLLDHAIARVRPIPSILGSDDPGEAVDSNSNPTQLTDEQIKHAFGIPLHTPLNPDQYSGNHTEEFFATLLGTPLASPIIGAPSLRHTPFLLHVGTDEMLLHDSINMLAASNLATRAPLTTQYPRRWAQTWCTPLPRSAGSHNFCSTIIPLHEDTTATAGAPGLPPLSDRFRHSHIHWDTTYPSSLVDARSHLLTHPRLSGRRRGTDIGLGYVLFNLRHHLSPHSIDHMDGVSENNNTTTGHGARCGSSSQKHGCTESDSTTAGLAWDSSHWASTMSYLDEGVAVDFIPIPETSKHLKELTNAPHIISSAVEHSFTRVNRWLNTFSSSFPQTDKHSSGGGATAPTEPPSASSKLAVRITLSPQPQPLSETPQIPSSLESQAPHSTSHRTLIVYPSMFHVFPLALFVPQAELALTSTASFVHAVRH